jgi:XRE family transcriptional regulator, aerobic/anaerobic benzoate catabolism transcriptional regulator
MAVRNSAPASRAATRPGSRGKPISPAHDAPADGPHPLLATLGAAVRTRRQALGWTRLALAQQSGLSLRFLAEVESGQANVSVLKLADLAQALRVPLQSLLTEGQPASSAADRPRVIALVGLRGAGKSTLGPLLEARLGMPFVELDTLIQESTGMALPELFELHGEDYYRRAEREALERVVQAGAPCLVAVSGGIVTDPGSLALLRERTLMVWVRARPEQYMRRAEAQGDRRPMANRPNAMAELHALLRARTPLYRQARITLDTSTDSVEASAQKLAAEIQQLSADAAE